jgi:glycosyltransferase involved in cell wall biosynthesis
MIGTSWGFDVLDETRLDPDRAQRASEVLKRCDLVFVDNDAPQREVIALGADPTRIVQFPWGLSADWFAGPAPNVPLTGPYVTFLSTRRHEPVYRVGDIVDAFLEVAATHSHARLEIAGSGSLTSGYREAVAIRGLQSQVSFLGELTPGDLRDQYRAADVYVTASSVDGTSVSLLEAMASGRCVVASRIEGNAQWVDDSTGFHFQCGDIEALSGIMSGLLRDSNEVRVGAQARADAARVRVEQKANWPRTVDQFSGFARQAIRNSKERA